MALAALVALAVRWLGRGGPARVQLGERAFLALLVTLAAGVRVAWVMAVPNRLVSDFAIYHELAVALVSGQGYTLTGPIGQEDLALYLGTDKTLPYTTAYRAPGTPLLAALLYRVFGVHPVLMKAASVLLGTATALLLYRLLARAGQERAGRIAALDLGALSLGRVRHQPVRQRGPVHLRADRRRSARGAAARLRPRRRRRLPVPADVAADRLAQALARRRQPRAIVLFLAGMAIAIAPWTARNALTFHRFIPICTSDGEFAARHSTYAMPPEVRESPRFDRALARVERDRRRGRAQPPRPRRGARQPRRHPRRRSGRRAARRRDGDARLVRRRRPHAAVVGDRCLRPGRESGPGAGPAGGVD